MRIVCISDTHVRHTEHKIKVPDGDLLIHAGDLTISGTFLEIAEAGRWLKSLPHEYKVVIAGNHDFLFQKDINTAKLALDAEGDLIYLQDEVAALPLPGSPLIWGSPWTPRFYDWAFQLKDRRPESERPFLLKAGDKNYRDPDEHWARIPEEVQILITHGPPKGIMDQVVRRQKKIHPTKGDYIDTYEERTGCPALAARLKDLKRLRLHVFGHIHPGYGVVKQGDVTFVNASTCDSVYLPVNPPIVVDLNF